MTRELHVSCAETFTRCQREYELARVHRVAEPGYAPALAQGGAMHAAGEALRLGQGVAGATVAACQELRSRGVETLTAEAREWETAKVGCMITAYLERWGADSIRTKDNEVTLRAPLIDASGKRRRGFSFVGTVDALVGDMLYEMKTTSDTVHETEAYLREGLQVPAYNDLVQRALGVELQSNLVDIIKKPVVKRRKIDTPAEWGERALADYRARPNHFFRRAELPVDESRIRWARDVLFRIAGQVRECDRYGYMAVRGWSCCKRAYGWCRYKELCWHGADIEESEER